MMGFRMLHLQVGLREIFSMRLIEVRRSILPSRQNKKKETESRALVFVAFCLLIDNIMWPAPSGSCCRDILLEP